MFQIPICLYDGFMFNLYFHLGFSTWEIHALQRIGFVAFDVVDKPFAY